MQKIIIALALVTLLGLGLHQLVGRRSKRTDVLSSDPSIPAATLERWNSWKVEHSKRFYNKEQELTRFNIFQANLKSIQEHNANPKNTYYKAVNQFTAMSDAEFKAIYLT